jgi:ribosomal protein S27AE
MQKRNGLKLMMHACPRCGGSAYLEDPHENEWRCLQCARPVPSPQPLRRTRQAA